MSQPSAKPGSEPINHIAIALILLIFGYFVYRLGYWITTTIMLYDGTKTTSAIILSDRNFDFLDMASKTAHEANYTYYYTVNGINYKEDAHSTHYRPGDTVTIAYVPNYPGISKIISR